MDNPEIIVIGAGPGGYVCAIRLAQLGKKVLLVDKDKIGGVCLNRGCIPTKTLLHYAKVISEVDDFGKVGIKFNKPVIDFTIFNQHVKNISVRLGKGIDYLLRSNGVEFLHAEAKFSDNSTVSIITPNGAIQKLNPHYIVIATGSKQATLPNIKPDGKNIITSDEALEINEVPKSLAIIGAGAVGLEFATIYARFGSKIKVIEIMPQILPGIDSEFANLLMNILKKQEIEFLLDTKSTKVSKDKIIHLTVQTDGKEQIVDADKLLLAVGRMPNTEDLALENTDIKLTDKKFVNVNENYETSQKQTYAIGDIIGPPLLAHKAMAQGTYVAEKIVGLVNITPPKIIPNCIYTDPELATVGLDENEAKSLGYDITLGKVPLSAISRARTINRIEGMVKIIANKKTDEILGAQILAPEASNLINELTLAINAGIKIDKIVNTIHPHPTLSEAISEAVASIHKKAIHIINK